LSKNKTFSSEISQRYALAFYDLAQEKNITQQITSNIVLFKNIFESNQDLKNFVKNPTHSLETQKMVFEKILSLMNLDSMIKNFFLILIIKKRIFFLDKIIDEFLKLVSIKKGEVSANLISSKKIDNKTILEIEKEISTNINKTIKLYSRVDESLIGGVVLQIGSLMIDASIKNRLQKYKKLMIEA
tara:strand:- start:895 stop:1452 length:558 start_codon:yes stop_codon:yes gene_type:complete